MPRKPKDLIVWGAGSHAKVVADIVRLGGRHKIVAFVEDAGSGDQPNKFLGVQLLSEREQLAALLKRGGREMVIAIGNCSTRLRLAAEAQQTGFELCEPLVHPKATVARSASLGRGTVVAAGAVVNPAAILGENVIVNTGATVDHDCILEDGVHICPGAHLAGNVTVCRGTWIGIGAIAIEKIRIGKGVMIGAGAVVVSNIPDGVLALGCPARVVADAQLPAICV